VRDNPESARPSREKQFDALRRVSQALSELGVPLLYELLVPATHEQLARVNGDPARYDRDVRPELVVAVIADNQAAAVEPSIWKIEGLETADAARAVVAQARAGGRSIWDDAVRAYHDGERGDEATSREVRDRYLDFVRHYYAASGATIEG
jgi:myo-inositol catabolism protein IolC